jgi:hypothetical protein
MEREILPWLRQQAGFLDLITLAVSNGREVATISFWDEKANTPCYDSSCYPEALKILAELLEGTPYVKTFNNVSSTFQRGAFAQLAQNLIEEHMVDHEVPPKFPPFSLS